MDYLFDRLRLKKLAALPEEVIRQKVIRLLIKRGYPKALILIEQKLSSLPLARKPGEELPDRRIDVLVLRKDTLKPLLLIECKAIPLTRKAFMQVIGYNYYIEAPWMGLVNESSCLMGLKSPVTNSITFYQDIPPYEKIHTMNEQVDERHFAK